MGARLAGRVAVITGGARGLGLGIATRFADEGATVIIADRDEATARDAAVGIDAIAAHCDVTSRASVDALVAGVVERHGSLDVLVANAGITGGGAFLDLPDERWNAVIDTNLRGVFLCDQIAGRRMAQQGSGAIVNVTSIMGARSNPATAAYCAAKAGVISLTGSAALALARTACA